MRLSRRWGRLIAAGIVCAAVAAAAGSPVFAVGSEKKDSGNKESAKGESGEKMDTASMLYQQGMEQSKAGDFEKARDSFEKANRERKHDPEILNMLAFTQRKTGKLKEAFANYEKALELKPRFPQAREYLGEAHLQGMMAQLKELKSYGPEGEKELALLVAALRAATAEVNAEFTGPNAPAGTQKW